MPRYPNYGQQDDPKPAPTSPAGGPLGRGGATSPGPQAPGQVPELPTTTSGQEDKPLGAPTVDTSYGNAAKLAGDQSGGGGVQAQGVGTGYTNFQSILAANSKGADQMATTIGQNAYSKAATGVAPTDGRYMPDDTATIKDGGSDLKQIQTQPGLQALLQSQYKNQAYSEGASALDSYLAGSSGNAQFASAQKAYETPIPTPTATKPARPSPIKYDPDDGRAEREESRRRNTGKYGGGHGRQGGGGV